MLTITNNEMGSTRVRGSAERWADRFLAENILREFRLAMKVARMDFVHSTQLRSDWVTYLARVDSIRARYGKGN
jgi:hypothetical protein